MIALVLRRRSIQNFRHDRTAELRKWPAVPKKNQVPETLIFISALFHFRLADLEHFLCGVILNKGNDAQARELQWFFDEGDFRVLLVILLKISSQALAQFADVDCE